MFVASVAGGHPVGPEQVESLSILEGIVSAVLGGFGHPKLAFHFSRQRHVLAPHTPNRCDQPHG